jgi:hypothetical protein
MYIYVCIYAYINVYIYIHTIINICPITGAVVKGTQSKYLLKMQEAERIRLAAHTDASEFTVEGMHMYIFIFMFICIYLYIYICFDCVLVCSRIAYIYKYIRLAAHTDAPEFTVEGMHMYIYMCVCAYTHVCIFLIRMAALIDAPESIVGGIFSIYLYVHAYKCALNLILKVKNFTLIFTCIHIYIYMYVHIYDSFGCSHRCTWIHSWRYV